MMLAQTFTALREVALRLQPRQSGRCCGLALQSFDPNDSIAGTTKTLPSRCCGCVSSATVENEKLMTQNSKVVARVPPRGASLLGLYFYFLFRFLREVISEGSPGQLCYRQLR